MNNTHTHLYLCRYLLLLFQVPIHNTRKTSSEKLPRGPAVSQSTALPSNTDRTGAVISISNGNIETQSGAASCKLWPSEVEPYELGHIFPKADMGGINYNEHSKDGEVDSVPDIVTTGTDDAHHDNGTYGGHLKEGVHDCSFSHSEEKKSYNEYDLANEELRCTRDIHGGGEERWNNLEYIRKYGDTSNDDGTKEANCTSTEKDMEEQSDAIFDHFLDTRTCSRLRLLTAKVASLTQALQAAKDECNSLVSFSRQCCKVHF